MWLFSLARRELQRRYHQLRVDARINVPIEEPASLPDDDERSAGYDAEQPLDIIEKRIEPSVVSLGDLLADDRSLSPDAAAAEHDLIDYLHHATAHWPEQERAVFDLHFLEGFDAVEVALLENIKPEEAEEVIGRVQSRLRGLLSTAAGLWSRAQPLSTSG
jgi:DNA-directed RNA polymerase specialized sigma24 family protein